jgi:hypothetical protein
MKSFVLLVLLCLISCLSIQEDRASGAPVSLPQKGTFLPWKASELIGYTYTLVSDKAESILSFSEHGIATYTGGPKGGPYASPLLYWAIDDNGKLKMGGSPGFTSFSWTKIEETGDKVVVESNGQRATYLKSRINR